MTQENALMMQAEQSLLEQVVRVHDEPYRYYDDWDVHALLTVDPVAYINHIMTRLKQIADGNSEIELPDKLVLMMATKCQTSGSCPASSATRMPSARQ